MQKSQRPQLTFKILLYAIFDVAGMVLFATGAMWLAQGKALFIADFPTSMTEAVATVIAGLVLMIWAASQILRELLKRPANTAQEGN